MEVEVNEFEQAELDDTMVRRTKKTGGKHKGGRGREGEGKRGWIIRPELNWPRAKCS